jgi:glucokinase
VLADALNLADTLLADAGRMELAMAGIGLGVCELVDLGGNITSGHTIAWRSLPIRDAFAHLAPALVESDVRAAALAEAVFGAGRPFKQFVYVTVGTGISSCLVQEGRPYAGARGNALILASSPLTTCCPNCGTRVATVLEEFAAGPALVRRYNHSIEETGLKSQLPADEAAKHGEDVLAAAEVNDPVAIEVVKTAGEALGVSVAWLVNVLDPAAVIIGGGLGLAGGLYWTSFVASTRAHIWAEASRAAPLIPASLGPEAGMIGAAAAAAFSLGLASYGEV